MYLGLDLGTSGVKALLIDGDQNDHRLGHRRARRFAPASRLVRAGSGRLDPRHAKTAIAGLKAAHPQELAAVRGIGLSGQMHGATLLDAGDKVLRPCILWNDTRSHAEAAALDADPRFRALTGNIVFPGLHRAEACLGEEQRAGDLRQGRQGAAAEGLSAPLADRRAHFGNVGFGRHVLARRRQARAGRRSCSRRPASTRGRCRAGRGHRQAGTLRAELAARWGMGAGVVVAGGAGDNAASACGMGTVGAGHAFVSLGTSGVLFAANASYLPNPESAVHTFCHALPNTWHQMGVILSATDSLNWLSGDHRQERRRADRRTRRHAEGADRRHLPALSLGRAHAAQRCRASAAPSPGSAMRSSRAVLTQAVLEGVTFAFRDSLEALQTAGTDADARHRDRRRLALALLAEGDRHRARPAGRHPGRRRFRRGLRRRPARPDRADRRRSRSTVCTAPATAETIEPDAALARAPIAARLSGAIARSIPHIRRSFIMSTGFFGDIKPDQIRRPRQHQSAGLPLLQPRRGRARQADGRPSALRRRLLALLRLAGRRPVRRPDLRAPVVRATRWSWPS